MVHSSFVERYLALISRQMASIPDYLALTGRSRRCIFITSAKLQKK